MGSRSRVFIRDDQETELGVDYEVNGGSEPSGMYGPPEHYDPGSSPEVIVTGAWLLADANNVDAPQVELTEAERERFEQEVIQDPETWEPDYPDHDYDD